jgi:folate-dependent phosphoribosylglycinamide formyltransferase PurN
MKILFLFHDSWTQYPKADWLASRIPLDGFLVIKKTRPWWGAYLWRRARRIGFGKVANEAALRLYWLLTNTARDRRMTSKLLEDLKHDIPAGYQRPPVHTVYDINSPEAEALLKRLNPDVCVLMVNVILKKKIFSIPRLGMLVFHPGLTPEYRGPHSAFWATMNHQFWGIGWSLLRVDEGIDTGNVLAQGSAAVDPLTESHVYMQHKSHVDGLPHVVETLRQLAAGEQPNVDVRGRKSFNYTHPGLSDYLRLRRFLNGLRRGATPPGPRSVRLDGDVVTPTDGR